MREKKHGKQKQERTGGNKLPPFVPLTWEMLNSRAYKELTPSSAKALPYFLGKVKLPYHDPEKYRIEFEFRYSEAERLGFANTTFYRSITKLIDFGFMDPVSKGGKKSSGYSSNRFKLSERWKGYGTKDFRKVKSWSEFYQYK